MSETVNNKENVPPRPNVSNNTSELLDHHEEEASRSMKLPSIDDFDFLKPISRGAFGKVFLGCKKCNRSKKYAIKVMKKADMVNKNMVSQVIAERDALALSKSPFIVRLYYSLQSEENVFLVMEYMIGGDLKSLLVMSGYFDESMAIAYIAEVTLALEYLHCHGIIHRDLKPDNMLIARDGHIKLTDFGLSKLTINRQISITDVVSTPGVRSQRDAPRDLDLFRTPGQILSLTSHLAFGMSAKKLGHLQSKRENSALSNSFSSPVPMRVEQLAKTPVTETITPPPVKSLTPVLMDPNALHYSTASDQSSRMHPSQLQSCTSAAAWMDSSSCLEDSVFQHSTHMTSRAESRLSVSSINDYSRPMSRSHRKGRRSHRPGSNLAASPESSARNDSSHVSKGDEDDTPLLYRSKEMVQKSFAAQNLKSLREGSFTDESVTNSHMADSKLETNTSVIQEEEVLSQDDSIKFATPETRSMLRFAPLSPDPNFSLNDSIERGRQTSSAICSPEFHALSKPRFSIEPIEHEQHFDHPIRTSESKKRPFKYVEKSPLQVRGHTGLTMEFYGVKIGDEDRIKRPNLSEDVDMTTSPVPSQSFTDTGIPRSACTDSGVDVPDRAVTIPVTPVTTQSGESRIKKMSGDAGLSVDCSLRPPAHSPSFLSPDQRSLTSPNSACLADHESLDSSLNNMSIDEKMNDRSQAGTTPKSPQESQIMPPPNPTQFSVPIVTPPVIHRQNSPPWLKKADDLPRKIGWGSTVADDSIGDSNLPRPDPVTMSEATLSSQGSLPITNSSQDENNASCTNSDVSDDKGRQRTSSGSESESRYAPRKRVIQFRSLCIPNSFCSTQGSGFQTPFPKANHPKFMTPACNGMRTPFRTPKSVRRGRPVKEERILGTPDYLAPELLLQKEHGPGVDWWALGVCLYEFLTGIPPFNDETPELVFQNILNKDITWPDGEEALSEEAYHAISILLNFKPEERPHADGVKKLPLFADIDWENLHDQEAPFLPCPDDDTDTSYFDARNNMQHLQVSAIDM